MLTFRELFKPYWEPEEYGGRLEYLHLLAMPGRDPFEEAIFYNDLQFDPNTGKVLMDDFYSDEFGSNVNSETRYRTAELRKEIKHLSTRIVDTINSTSSNLTVVDIKIIYLIELKARGGRSTDIKVVPWLLRIDHCYTADKSKAIVRQ